MPQTVLVVDDDKDIVDLTRLVLERGGYRVCSAGTGREALGLVRSEHPDLILLDINMPGMDGWQVLKLLKLDETTREVPVAMFTIRGEVRDKVRGIQDGAFDYVAKPFTYDELLRRVEAIFEAAGSGRRASA